MRYYQLKYLLILWLTAAAVTDLSGQTTDSLNHYLKIAAQNNAGVKADFLAYKASLQKIPQAGAYEDPQLEMGFYLEPMDLIDGRQIGEFKLMQMFPWFGTKKAAQTEMTHMAQMTFEQFRETRDALYLSVYAQWYTLCRLQQQLRNNDENKKLLAQLEELAIRRFATPGSGPGQGYSPSASTPAAQSKASAPSGGSGMAGMGTMGSGSNTQASSGSSMSAMSGSGDGMASGMGSASPGLSDVLRIRLEATEIDNNIESLQSELKAEKAKFNALLNRPTESGIQVPDSFEQLPFLFDSVSVKESMESRNPMLGMIREEGLAYKAKGEMDRKMSYPMFGVGLQYMLIGKSKKSSMDMETGAGMSSMDGKDMLMPMISVSIPLYRNKYKAQQRESKFRQQSSAEKYVQTLNTLEADWYKTRHQLDDAARKITLYEKQEELAKTTYRLIVNEFVAGKNDLTNVIQVQRQLLDYQLKKAEAVADYNIMVASVRKLISFQSSEQ